MSIQASITETRQEQAARSAAAFSLRPPNADDGPAVRELIAACPPLDRNSLYCNLLQCTDFADTCIVAERGAGPEGWVSGYVPPADPHALFVWQVAVHPEARGEGLAGRMILALLERPACEETERIETTITPDNDSSWALFAAVARRLNAPIERRLRFDAEIHFRGRHDSEHQVTIGPISSSLKTA